MTDQYLELFREEFLKTMRGVVSRLKGWSEQMRDRCRWIRCLKGAESIFFKKSRIFRSKFMKDSSFLYFITWSEKSEKFRLKLFQLGRAKFEKHPTEGVTKFWKGLVSVVRLSFKVEGSKKIHYFVKVRTIFGGKRHSKADFRHFIPHFRCQMGGGGGVPILGASNAPPKSPVFWF